MLSCIFIILWMIEQYYQQTDRFLYSKWFYKNIC